MGITGTSVITPAVNAYFFRLLLIRNKPRLIHAMFAQRFSLPSGNGKAVVWRRYAQLATATEEVAEGVTPPGKQLSKTDIRATVSQYGDWVSITDVLEFTAENNVLNSAASELNDQLMRTEDELARNVLVSSASAITADQGTPEVTAINDVDINQVTNTLQNSDALPVAPMIGASTGQGTAPIQEAYWAMMHTELNTDLKMVSGYLSTAEYPGQRSVIMSERGSVEELRFLASSIADKQGSATEAFPSTAGTYYYIPIIARNAYGVVSLEKANAKMIIHARGTAGAADPLNQRQSMAWKFMNVARILNDLNVIVLKVTKRSDT